MRAHTHLYIIGSVAARLSRSASQDDDAKRRSCGGSRRARFASKTVFVMFAVDNYGGGFTSARRLRWEKRPVINVVNVQQLLTKTLRRGSSAGRRAARHLRRPACAQQIYLNLFSRKKKQQNPQNTDAVKEEEMRDVSRRMWTVRTAGGGAAHCQTSSEEQAAADRKWLFLVQLISFSLS